MTQPTASNYAANDETEYPVNPIKFSCPQINVAQANAELKGKSAAEILRWCLGKFDPARAKLSTSFGSEGTVLVHMLAGITPDPRVFTIDTGRNFQEYYDVWQKVEMRFGLKVETYGPEAGDIAKLMGQGGPNLFYESVEKRKLCCFVRKVKPLHSALADGHLWIAGLRRGQSESRADQQIFSYVEEYQVYKVCPIVDWSEDEVWDYIREHQLDYNKLYDKGFRTIGCQPCSRALHEGEDIRAGRWWWETDTQKECGIHIEGGQVRRKKVLNWSI